MRLIEAKDFSVIVVVVCVIYLMISVLTNVQDLNDEYTYEYIDEKEIPIPDLKPANNINAQRETKPKTLISSIAIQGETRFDLRNSSGNSLDHNLNPALQNCFIVIFIPSMAKSANLRQELRTRWLNMSMWREEEFQGIKPVYLNFKLMFVLGKHQDKEYSAELLEEVAENKDMFLTEFEENKATLKDKLLWALRESVKLYNFTYFVKVDHDTLIDLPNLIKGSITSPKDNLYTGYCNKMLLGSAYKRTFRYCLGGGYIFSRDLVEKIAMLEDNETDVEIWPEDGYAGYLAWMVKKKYDLKGNIPQRSGGWRLKIYTKNVIKFTRYFYHWLKNHHKLERMFQCRIKADKTECPSLQYVFENGESKECTCYNSDAEADPGEN